MVSSYKDIAHPSPHNIYYVGWSESGVSRGSLCLAYRPSVVPSIGFASSWLVCTSVSTLSLFRRTCVLVIPYKVSIMSCLLTVRGSEQDIDTGVGILPRTDCTFISRVHDPPGSAGFNRYVLQVHKKSDLPGREPR